MAEFQDVMKQWRRMCDKMREQGDWCQSAICPLGGKCQLPSTTDIAEVERVVMQWAAEHPEPVYPTWGEWLEKQGVVKTVLSPRYEENGASYYTPMYEITNPIPGDIAEKLGLKPKEGTEWEN